MLNLLQNHQYKNTQLAPVLSKIFIFLWNLQYLVFMIFFFLINDSLQISTITKKLFI